MNEEEEAGLSARWRLKSVPLVDGTDDHTQETARGGGSGEGEDPRTGLLKLSEVPESPRTHLVPESEERHALGCVLDTTLYVHRSAYGTTSSERGNSKHLAPSELAWKIHRLSRKGTWSPKRCLEASI